MDRYFLILHRRSDGNQIAIHVKNITLVSPAFDENGEEYACIYVVGDKEPFEVTETMWDILCHVPSKRAV